MATKIENAFERILNRLEESDEGVQTKTAAVASEPSAEARMLETVRRVSSAASTKTASASAPAADLQRMAKQAQALEEQAMVKEAHFMGAAIADGFMERFAQYDVALNNAGVKTASADPSLVKAAAEEGYRMAVADMEKTAEAEYVRGYEDTLRGVHKLASEVHYGGQAMARNVLVGLGQKTANYGDLDARLSDKNIINALSDENANRVLSDRNLMNYAKDLGRTLSGRAGEPVAESERPVQLMDYGSLDDKLSDKSILNYLRGRAGEQG